MGNSRKNPSRVPPADARRLVLEAAQPLVLDELDELARG